MNVRFPSASKLDRALACPASCWLPPGPEGGSSAAAERGTRIHKALERSYLGARVWDALACVLPSEVTQAQAAIDGKPSVLPFQHWPLVEAEIWYHPLSQEVQFGVTPDCHHTNPAPPPLGFYRGTVDLMGEDPETGLLTVVDHKTGNPRFQTSPAVSAQHRHGAMLYANHPETAQRVAAEGVQLWTYLTQKAGTKGALVKHTATGADLADFAARYQDLAMTLDAVDAGELDPESMPPVVNPYCKFCPAAANCPAYLEAQSGAA